MIKFEKVNITKFSQSQHIPYYELDLLRQTTIERLVEEANKYKFDSVQLKRVLLNNINRLLDKMLIEEEN